MDATATPCAVEFCKFCRCKAIFEPKYLRTHRAGGTKVLRCFPHCCPTHVFNSVCGSSVVTRVSGDRAILERSITYLRFEASYDDALPVGGIIREDIVLANTRRQTHGVGEWIASHYDGLDETTTTRVSEFSPKAQTTLGWHYRWIGGSARQQRQAMHTLRAYVFERIAPHSTATQYPMSHAGPALLRVVATATSPPFIVMSYRRACKTCQRQSPEDADDECQCEGIYRIPNAVPGSPSAHHHHNPSMAAAPTYIPLSLPRHGTSAQDRPHYHHRSSPLRVAALCGNSGIPLQQVQEMEVVLATVYSFAASFSMLPSQVPHFSALWAQLPRRGPPPAAIESPSFQFLHELIPPDCRVPTEFDHVVRGISGVMAQWCTSEGATVHAFLQQHAASLFHKAELEHSYRELVLRVYASLNDAIALTHMTLADLAHEVVRLCQVVASAPRSPVAGAASLCMAARRRYNSSHSFEWFVAQMREIYMAMEAPPAPLTRSPITSSPLDGKWRFHRFLTMSSSSPPPLSLWPSMLTTLRASTMGLLGFQLAFSPAPTCTLRVKATSGDLAHQTCLPPSEFTLNETPQVLRVFPNGETTMGAVSNQLSGDYVGTHHAGREGDVARPAVGLSLFSWPLDAADPDVAPQLCYHVKIHAVVVDPYTLHVRLQVLAAPERSRGSSGAIDYWGLDVAQRVACYDTPNEQLLLELHGEYDRRIA